MRSLEDSFKAAMNLLPVLVYMGLSEMIKPIIARDIEERLGRKLTEDEWRYYIRETYRKREAKRHQQIREEQYQQLVDRQIIHDFAWNEG